MAIVHIVSGNSFKVPTLNIPEAKIIDKVVITITDLHPGHVACTFSDPAYKHDHAGAASWGTALDIDCRKKKGQLGEAVRVTFKIDQKIKNVEFIPFPLNPSEPPDPTEPDEIPLAVTAGSNKALAMLADLEFDKSSATFLVQWTGHKKPAPFNLGFLFTDDATPNLKMPVIYDPKVQNDG